TQRVHGWTRETGVEAAGGQVRVDLQLLLELRAAYAQVRFLDVGDRQPRIVVELLGNRVELILGQARARIERIGVVAHRELLDFFEEALEVGGLRGELVVIPGGGCERRQHDLVGHLDAGIRVGKIRGQIEVEDLRKQDDAVEIDAVIGLEVVDDNGGE